MNGRRWSMAVAVAILGIAGQVQAQSFDIAGDGGLVTPPRSAEFDLTPSAGELPELDLPLTIDLPSYNDDYDAPETSLVDQVSFKGRVPGSMAIKYRGIRGFLVKHINRRLRSYWGRSLREVYKRTFISEEKFRQLRERRGWALHDHAVGGRWWNRRWYESFTPEDGGVWKGVYVHEKGRRTHLVKWGAFSINNEFRIRIDKVALNLGEASSRIYREDLTPDVKAAHEHAVVGRSMMDPDVEDEEEERREEAVAHHGMALPSAVDLWIGHEPSGKFITGVSWKLRIRPSMRMRVSMNKFETALRLRGRMEVHVGMVRKTHVLNLRWRVDYDPFNDHEVAARVEINLLTW